MRDSLVVDPSVAVALAYYRSVYDSLYLALAVSQGCALITADERLCNAPEKTDLAAYLQLL